MGPIVSAATVVIAATLLDGCASSVTMIPASSQQIAPPPADMAQVVFMRTSFISGAIGADLFEVVGGELRLIGVLYQGKKVVYRITPGHKVFMAHGVAADFMLGDLAAGRTYYAIVRPNWGSGGMIPTPIRADGTTDFNMSSPHFRDWIRATELVEPNSTEAKAWISTERERNQKIYEEYWTEFQNKTPEQKSERTLRPQDGVASEQLLTDAYVRAVSAPRPRDR